jgi:predicted transposase YdaD
MKARTHAGDEQKSETSAHHETKETSAGRQEGIKERGEADKQLKKQGLTVSDVASQSAYEDDKNEVAHQAANMDRNDSK